MKATKHHLVNWKSGKTNCGIDFKKDSIRLAELDDGNWYNDYGKELDIESNWESIFCMTCLRLHETNLIEQFKLNTFLIQYELALPKTNRLRKKKKANSRRNRIDRTSIDYKKIGVNKAIDKAIAKIKSNPIPKSKKGIERDKKKQLNKTKSKSIKSNSLTNKVMDLYSIPTESKCVVKSKPIEDKPIDLVNEIKPLIDLSNGPVTIETIDVEPIDNWEIGDPIDDDIFELVIGSDWKLIRHDTELDKWQFISKQIVKGKPKWIADSEWIDYKDASELIIDGYCE